MRLLSPTTLSQERLLAIIQMQTEIAKARLDLAEIMNLVVGRAMALTGAAGSVVELAEGEDMVYRAVAGTAGAHLGLRLKREGSLSGLCVNEKLPMVCEDTEFDDRVDREACRKIGVRSMILVPLLSKDEAIGVLKILSPKASAFQDRDLITLTLLCGCIAASMVHASELESSKARSERLFLQATQDSLTGVSNRALFYDRLRRQISEAKREKRQIGILMMDMNGLKSLNDEIGHHAGDAALRELAARSKKFARESDTVARLGGDEFALILTPVKDRDGLEGAAKRL
ncbi:MAG: GGDEF domain-containing protein, partial [Spirochaetia bacterium]|nr:GGDEF domain-containing protein [Spirochaetia bacterium]